jgi:hypothetical protein
MGGNMAKETRAEPAELEGLIVEGKTQAQIVNICRDEYAEWDVSDRQIRNYVKTAWEQYAEAALGIDRKAEAQLAAQRLDYVYGKALEAGKLNTARLAIVDKIRLYKLDAPDQSYNWRKALEEMGLSAGDTFEQIVKQLSEKVANEADE